MSPPGNRRGEVVRQAVLQAALDTLGDEGYAGVTMDSVAARAGVHKTTVYRRWPDKEALLTDAVLHATITPFSLPDTGNIDADVLTAAQARADWLTGPFGRPLVAMIGAGGAQAAGVSLAIERIFSERRAATQARLDEAARADQLPAGVDADAFLRTLLAPIYFALLVTQEPVTPQLVSRAATIALTAARNHHLHPES